MAIILTVRHFPAPWGVDEHGRPPALAQRSLLLLRTSQRAFLAKNPAAHEPREIPDPITAYIGNGAWRISCRCKEATHTDPQFKQAYCFGCGAIYTHVIFPENYRAIEALLSLRPVQGHRNWNGQTFETLVHEQLMHQDPVVLEGELQSEVDDVRLLHPEWWI